ncbi:hypothetical protein ONZ45_g14341 [Pleurotus djamor]|nr:hypothetical protein ONZ45_g14341 [Pleurotus djamor]
MQIFVKTSPGPPTLWICEYLRIGFVFLKLSVVVCRSSSRPAAKTDRSNTEPSDTIDSVKAKIQDKERPTLVQWFCGERGLADGCGESCTKLDKRSSSSIPGRRCKYPPHPNQANIRTADCGSWSSSFPNPDQHDLFDSQLNPRTPSTMSRPKSRTRKGSNGALRTLAYRVFGPLDDTDATKTKIQDREGIPPDQHRLRDAI